MESDGDHFLAYYLTETDEAALEFKERRAAVAPYQIQEEEWVCFHHVEQAALWC